MTVMTGPRYPSLEALRVAHRELLDRYQASSQVSNMVPEIELFLQDARRTGVVLEADRPRTAGQSILDYWAASLYRLNLTPPVAVLEPYEPGLPPVGAAAEFPYPGLEPFDEESCRWFYGRQALIDDLCKALEKRSVIVVTGPRGCGKSSLVRAGLLPALQAGAVGDSAHWYYFPVVVPGLTPLENLARSFNPASADAAILTDEVAALRENRHYLADQVRDAGPSVLVVDQLHDLVPRAGESLTDDARVFLANLASLVEERDTQCRLVIVHQDNGAARSDEDDEAPTDDGQPWALLLAERFRLDVPELGTREMADAIVHPAEQVGLRFQDQEAMVADLVRALIGLPAAPLLLQFVLIHLWAERHQGRISWEGYRKVVWDPRRRRSHVGWVLKRTADALYDELATHRGAQAAIKQIMLKLVVPGRGSEPRLRRLRWATLRGGDAEQQQTAEMCLERLERACLIRVMREGSPDNPAVELIHAGLARFWDVLDGWLVEERERQEVRLRFEAAVEQWVAHGGGEAGLWDEMLLRDVRGFPDLTTEERRFIAVSEAVACRRHREAQRRRMAQVVGLTMLFGFGYLLAIALGWGAWTTDRRGAEMQSRQLVSQAQLLVGTQPDLAARMALEAYRVDGRDQTRAGILSVLQRNFQLDSVLAAKLGAVSGIAVSPDGILVGAVYTDTVVVWDMTKRQLEPVPFQVLADDNRQGIPVQALALSSNRRWLAVSLPDQQIRVWNVAERQAEPVHLRGGEVPPTSLAFGTRDDRLLAIGQDGSVTEYDLASGVPRSRLAWLEGPLSLEDAAISPDGSEVALATCTRTEAEGCGQRRVRIVNLDTQGTTWQTPDDALTTEVSSISFSHDGQQLAIGAEDGTTVVWHRASGAERRLMRKDPDVAYPVRSVAFSPDGMRLAVGSCVLEPSELLRCDAGEIRVWDLTRPNLVPPATSGQTGGTGRLAFLPNSDLLASAGSAQVLLWDVHRLRMRQVDIEAPAGEGAATGSSYDDPIMTSAARGPRVARWSADRGVRIQEGPNESEARLDLRQYPPLLRVETLAFDADGARLAIGSRDGTVGIWDVQGQKLVRAPLKAHTGAVRSLAFSQDGTLVASGGDRRVVVWDAATGLIIGTPLVNDRSAIQYVVFVGADQALVAWDDDMVIERDLGLTPWSVILERACKLAQRNLDSEERSEYGIDDFWMRLWMDRLATIFRPQGAHEIAECPTPSIPSPTGR